MHRQIQTLVQDAIDVVNRYPTSVIPDALGLIIQRAIVLGHQDCMRALRERGVIHDPCKGTAPVAATRSVEEQRLETDPTPDAVRAARSRQVQLALQAGVPAAVLEYLAKYWQATDAARRACGGSR